ncbi:hypothetical protein P8S54_07125 [Thiomicrospira sp. R3]|uniref:hypothetical protein n=1 Tax=Thiomicrospira sp. R3 TaxID=3035472 RepID=UPI00259B1D13|nr:hypothetical protein [Thiomicrospira sp. R3]WFE67997.1 hypothetical protein P8S54_07125 [Thiomicrospira sp. R3]
MIKFRWFWVLLFLPLAGCFESKPSDLAVEVMAKRYWQDQLQMQSLFALQDVKMLSAHKEGPDVYIAQVRYRVKAGLSEADLLARLMQADQEGQKTLIDQPGVADVVKNLPANFYQGQDIEFIKRLQFRDGSRGWLLEREISL